MLVLSRKTGESLQIGERIKITVVKLSGNRVRIGIDAPHDVHIRREELEDWSDLSFDSNPLPDEVNAA